VYDLDIPLVNGRVPFHKTAFELVKRCSQAAMPEGAIKEQIDRLVDKFFHELAAQVGGRRGWSNCRSGL
jgi:hypothetical protein